MRDSHKTVPFLFEFNEMHLKSFLNILKYHQFAYRPNRVYNSRTYAGW